MLLILGVLMGFLTVILSFIELVPFFNAVSQLNSYSKSRGPIAWIWYPFRLITLLPMCSPILLDVSVAMICGGIGLSGGPTAATIALVISASASLLVKFYRHILGPMFKKKHELDINDWRLANS